MIKFIRLNTDLANGNFIFQLECNYENLYAFCDGVLMQHKVLDVNTNSITFTLSIELVDKKQVLIYTTETISAINLVWTFRPNATTEYKKNEIGVILGSMYTYMTTYETVTYGSTVGISNNYDRGFTDGLILGQMI